MPPLQTPKACENCPMTCARDRPARAVEQVGGTVQGPHHFRSRHHCPAVAVERQGMVGGAAVRGSSWTELLDSAPQSPRMPPRSQGDRLQAPQGSRQGSGRDAYLICSWWEGHVASLCFFYYVNKILLQGLTPGEEVLPTEHLLFAEMALKAHFLLLHRHPVILALFARLTFLSP